jgi:hypothetical protein
VQSVVTTVTRTAVIVHAIKAYRESIGTATLILNLGARWGHFEPVKELRWTLKWGGGGLSRSGLLEENRTVRTERILKKNCYMDTDFRVF